MKIASKVETNNPIINPSYPYIGQYKENQNFLVLFHSKDSGMVIGYGGKDHPPIGGYNWSWEENDFDIFHGTVELTV